MLQLTPKAAQHLIQVRGERGVVRFVSKDGRVGIAFTLAPMDGDRVVDGQQIKVFVAPEVATALDESIIDARDEDGRTALVMRKRAASMASAASPARSPAPDRPTIQ
jgi:Fe-S cluster assembly iron-binding protein IscA